jgi:hypothetical protein
LTGGVRAPGGGATRSRRNGLAIWPARRYNAAQRESV